MPKIPAHAKCVFKGIVFDTYQWEQKLFDGSTAIFEMLKRVDVTQVIAISNGQILYAKQEQPSKPPYLSLFGGKAENGEDPLMAAKRELLEETGMVSDRWELLVVFDAQIPKTDWSVYTFIARDCRKVQEPKLDGGEKIEVMHASIDDFIKNVIPDPSFKAYSVKGLIMNSFNSEEAKKLKDILFRG